MFSPLLVLFLFFSSVFGEKKQDDEFQVPEMIVFIDQALQMY